MPAPRNPNTGPATAAVKRRAQDTKAAHLRAAGWVVVPPEQLDTLPDLPADATLADWLAARGLPPTASLADLIAHERVNAALAVAFRLQDQELLEREDLQESLAQMRRGQGRVVHPAEDS
jgi:hypothetical protein